MNIVATVSLVAIASATVTGVLYLIMLGQNLQDSVYELVSMVDKMKSDARDKREKFKDFLDEL